MTNEAGKGSKRRPMLIPRQEWELRWNLAYNKITREEFEEGMKKLEKQNVRKG